MYGLKRSPWAIDNFLLYWRIIWNRDDLSVNEIIKDSMLRDQQDRKIVTHILCRSYCAAGLHFQKRCIFIECIGESFYKTDIKYVSLFVKLKLYHLQCDICCEECSHMLICIYACNWSTYWNIILRNLEWPMYIILICCSIWVPQ